MLDRMRMRYFRAIHAALLCCAIAACGGSTEPDPVTYDIRTQVRPSGGGIATGDSSYPAGASVHLHAVAATGYLFANWTESDTVVGTAPDYNFTASRAQTFVANFTRQCSLTLVQAAGGAALLTLGGSTGACGRTVTVTATAVSGFAFTGWSNGATENPLTFTLNTDLVLTPSFAAQCTLTLTQGTGGTAAVTAGTLTGNCGRPVMVTATAAADFAFGSWSNGATANPLTLTLNADLALTPRFDAQCTLTLAQVAGGTATIASGSLTGNCGRPVTVVATPAPGFAFAGWSNGSMASTVTLVLDASLVLSPSFVAQCTVTLLQSAGGTAAITSGSAAGSCSRSVTVTATPAAGFAFSNWSNGEIANPLTLVVNSAISLAPSFAAQCTLTLVPATGGTATLTSGTLTGNCGRSVTVTAEPAANFVFSSWSNGAFTNPVTLVLDSNLALTPTFTAQCTLTLGPTTGGSAVVTAGTLTGSCGRSVTVTATPAADFSFAGWSNGATANPLTLVLSTDLTLTPNFIGQCTVTLVQSTGGTAAITAGTATGPCGRQVTITASAAAGFAFARWSNGFTANPLVITLTTDLPLSPVFSSQCTLTLQQVPGGTVSLTSGSLIGTCGRTVTVTATASSGFVFTGWSNGATSNPLTLPVNSNASLSPIFTAGGLTLSVSGLNNGAGTGTVTGPGIDCTIINGSASGDCTENYVSGTNVMLTASAAGGGNTFVGWAGACFARAACQLTITQATSVIAGFAPPVNYRLYGWDFSPFVDGQNPDAGATVTLAQVRQRLLLVAGYADWIRSFGSTGGIEYVGQVAHELGKKSACGAWIDANSADNEREITGLIASANAGYCDLLIVGSETQLRYQRNMGGVPESQLLSYIARVRQSTSGIPVTTADIYSILVSRPAIISAVDVVLANIYPFWEGRAVGDAINVVHAARQQLQTVSGGKEIIVSETGWPSCGQAVGSALPTLQNANSYFLSLVSWARSTSTKYFYFAALSESWKTAREGELGACWGVFDKAGVIVPGMQPVFDNITVPDTWSGNTVVGGPGTPSISFTHVPAYGNMTETLRGEVLHVAPAIYRVAVYIYVNGWWTKPTYESSTTTIAANGSWEARIVTGGTDHLATEIVAYLIPSNYTPPLAKGVAALPAELAATGFPRVSVTRSP